MLFELLFVEELVCLGEQLFKVGVLFVKGDGAEADVYSEVWLCGGIPLVCGNIDALAYARQEGVIYARGDDDEFIPAHPADDVLIAECLAQDFAHRGDGEVSRIVPEGVVYLFEPVHIRIEDMPAVPHFHRKVYGLLAEVQDAAPVVELCQLVRERNAAEP